jgi:uncharacterized protein
VSESSLSTEALTLKRWELRPPDGGAPIRGDLRLPAQRTPSSAVVICHGFKGFKDWGFFPSLARSLARRGHAAVSFNFSHSGVGPDSVDFSALHLFAENTHTRNIDEIHLVIDALSAGVLLGAPPRRVGLFGHSRGAGEAILAAAERERVHALVTWSALASVDRWASTEVDAWRRGETVYVPNVRTRQQMPVHSSFWEDIERNPERLDILAAARSLRIPWLIVHGEEDETVNARAAQLLHQGAGGFAELLLIAGAGHAYGAVHPFEGVTPELRMAIEATQKWFDAYLRDAPTTA